MDGVLGVTEAMLDWLRSLDVWVIYLGTGLFTTLETTALVGLVIPGDEVILLAGSTVTNPARFGAVVFAATTGAMIGESGGYALGRLVGPGLRHTRLGRRLEAERWARTEAYLHRRGGPALAAVRFVAVIHAIAPLVAGSLRMPFHRFFGWSVLGTVVWSSTLTGVGAVVGASLREYGGISLVVTATVLSLFGLVPLARWQLRRRRARRARTARGRDGRPRGPVGRRVGPSVQPDGEGT